MSSQSRLEALEDGTYLARIKAAPVDGKANAELVALVAKTLGYPKSTVSIKSGVNGRNKWVVVPGE